MCLGDDDTAGESMGGVDVAMNGLDDGGSVGKGLGSGGVVDKGLYVGGLFARGLFEGAKDCQWLVWWRLGCQ